MTTGNGNSSTLEMGQNNQVRKQVYLSLLNFIIHNKNFIYNDIGIIYFILRAQ